MDGVNSGICHCLRLMEDEERLGIVVCRATLGIFARVVPNDFDVQSIDCTDCPAREYCEV